MHDSGTARSADPGDGRRMGKDRRGERAVHPTGAGMHNHAGWLVDDQDVLVLVDYGERGRLRDQLLRGWRRDLDLDGLAAAEAVRRLECRAVDADETTADESLQARP